MSSQFGRKFYNCPFVRYFCALTATLPLIASCGPEAKFVGMSPTPVKSLAATSFVMSIDPTDAKITEGEFQKFRVYISDETQTKREITTDVSWSISDDKIALISPIEKGSFKGLAQGETAVTANFEGKKIIGTLHVQALPVKIIKGNPIVSLAISPQNPALSVGNALQLYAEATYTDGTKKDGTKKWLKIEQGKILPGVDYNYKFKDFTLSDKEIDFGALCTTILK